MRTLPILFLVLASAACAGGPKTAVQLEQLTTADLVREACSPAARAPDYARYDAAYRPLVLAELARRGKWSPEVLAKVQDGRIWIGAGAEHVVAAWGWPRNRSTYTSASGTSEIWHYGDAFYNPTTVSFENDRCTGWSKSR